MTSREEQFGPFHLIRELTHGVGVTSYLVTSPDKTRLPELTVLRRFPLSARATPSQRAQFVTNAETISKLEHANVVKLLEAGVIEDECYTVTEYVAGVDLATWTLQSGGTLPLDCAVYVLDNVCEGLRQLHALDVEHSAQGERVHEQLVHGQILSRNILLGFSGTVKLGGAAEFTLVQALSAEHNVENLLMHSFFAPEQLTGAHLDQRCDIYQLGLLLLEQLCERPLAQLFGSVGIEQRATRALQCLQMYCSGNVPPALNHLCQRALTEDPAARIESIGKFQSELLNLQIENNLNCTTQRLSQIVTEVVPPQWQGKHGVIIAASTERETTKPDLTPSHPQFVHDDSTKRDIKSPVDNSEDTASAQNETAVQLDLAAQRDATARHLPTARPSGLAQSTEAVTEADVPSGLLPVDTEIDDTISSLNTDLSDDKEEETALDPLGMHLTKQPLDDTAEQNAQISEARIGKPFLEEREDSAGWDNIDEEEEEDSAGWDNIDEEEEEEEEEDQTLVSTLPESGIRAQSPDELSIAEQQEHASKSREVASRRARLRNQLLTEEKKPVPTAEVPKSPKKSSLTTFILVIALAVLGIALFLLVNKG